MPQEDDLLYEEELLRNPYSLNMWCRWVWQDGPTAPPLQPAMANVLHHLRAGNSNPDCLLFVLQQ